MNEISRGGRQHGRDSLGGWDPLGGWDRLGGGGPLGGGGGGAGTMAGSGHATSFGNLIPVAVDLGEVLPAVMGAAGGVDADVQVRAARAVLADSSWCDLL